MVNEQRSTRCSLRGLCTRSSFPRAGDDSRRWPEASTMFFMWTAVEDRILRSWLALSRRRNFRHISLHFDGVRVSKELPSDVEEFCRLCSDHIYDETKLKVRIRQKEHLCFLDLLVKSARKTEYVDSVDDVLLQRGNCIPAALLDSVADKDAKVAALKDNSKQSNAQASGRGARTYRSVQADYGVRLLPCQGYRVLRPGQYLLHAECNGQPHCVRAVRDGDTVVVCNWRARYTVDAKAAAACSTEAIDGQSIVTFEVFPPGQEPKWPTEPPADVLLGLLDLKAVAGDTDVENELDDDLVVSVECTGQDDEAEARGTEDYEDDDETVIYVGDALLRELRAEVKTTIDMVRRRDYAPAGGSFRWSPLSLSRLRV